ncbi:MAG: NAD(+) synthase [Brumimicrobium sp.]|nr:NAD(+) synthase [Brumimicrobium sp.]
MPELRLKEVQEYIVNWLNEYCEETFLSGFVVGVSGGIDSALTSTLCALTGKTVVLVNMPIRQTTAEYTRAKNHIKDLENRFDNVRGVEVDLTPTFNQLEKDLPDSSAVHDLAMANSRARLRMLTLYAVGQPQGLLVAGTGNKVEDFGVGFFTKYGDGGVDISPIADLLKSEVYKLAEHAGVREEILRAKPTDGLWEDERNDEDQIGASYDELEWAMEFEGDENDLSERHKEVLAIYRRYHKMNKHKMNPIPVCIIPEQFRSE